MINIYYIDNFLPRIITVVALHCVLIILITKYIVIKTQTFFSNTDEKLYIDLEEFKVTQMNLKNYLEMIAICH